MKMQITLLLAVLMLFTACSEPQYIDEKPPETTEAPAEDWTPVDLSCIDSIDSVFSIHKFVGTCPRIKVDGDFVYVWPRNAAGLYRFHLSTGKTTKVCTDPLCVGGACPFAKGSDNWLVHDHFVYYTVKDSGVEKDPETGRLRSHYQYSIQRYDMINQKNEYLYKIPDDGSRYILFDILSDGCLYYTRSRYVENNTEQKAYYERYVCRTLPDKLGENEEILYTLPGNSPDAYSDLLEVNEEYFYLIIGAGESNRVARISRIDGSTDLLTFPYYYISSARIGDYCYYQSCSGEPVDYLTSTDGRGDVIVDENGEPVLTSMYQLYYTKRNLLTGEEILLGESPLMPSSYPAMVDGITDNYLYLDFEDGLWRCDHDGNKVKLVRSQEQLAALPIQRIDNRLIYGNWIFEANAETLVVYDMENGKYLTFELE